jgi:dUTP pyrophosphatase
MLSPYFELFLATTFQILQIEIIHHSEHPLPKYQTAGSAGMDIYAMLTEDIYLNPLERTLVPTGLFIALPQGYEAQIRPRSGLAIKQGITCLNSPGTIDSDYRGEIKVILINLSDQIQLIKNGDRIAQMVIAKYETITWVPVAELNESERGEGGFGSTG